MAYYEHSDSDDERETPRDYWDEIADHESLRLTSRVSDQGSRNASPEPTELTSLLSNQVNERRTITSIETPIDKPPSVVQPIARPPSVAWPAAPESQPEDIPEGPYASLKVTFSKEALALDPEHIVPENPVMQPQNMSAVELLSLRLPELKALARRLGLPITERVEGKSKVLNKAKLVSSLLAAPPIPVTNVELPYGIAKPGIISSPINITAPADGPVKRGRGRPKGSKNKPKGHGLSSSVPGSVAPGGRNYDEHSMSRRYDVEAD